MRASRLSHHRRRSHAEGAPLSGRGKRLPGALLLATIALLAIACVPPSLQTPEGRAGYTADQVVRLLQNLQSAAIDANAAIDPATGQPLLATATALRVVEFTIDSGRILKNAPEGWRASIGPAYAAMKDQLSAADRQRLGPYLAAVEAAIAIGGAP
jgi:hypothetical protein